MADTCRPATSLPLPIPSLGALGLLSRCNPVSSPSCERPPILFLPHVKCSVSDVVPTNPNTSYCTVRNMLQREASSELVPPVRTRWRALSTMESKARREKKKPIVDGRLREQPGITKRGSEKSHGWERPTASHTSIGIKPISRFRLCSVLTIASSTSPHCPQVHRMRAAGTSASSGAPHSG